MYEMPGLVVRLLLWKTQTLLKFPEAYYRIFWFIRQWTDCKLQKPWLITICCQIITTTVVILSILAFPEVSPSMSEVASSSFYDSQKYSVPLCSWGDLVHTCLQMDVWGKEKTIYLLSTSWQCLGKELFLLTYIFKKTFLDVMYVGVFI